MPKRLPAAKFKYTKKRGNYYSTAFTFDGLLGTSTLLYPLRIPYVSLTYLQSKAVSGEKLASVLNEANGCLTNVGVFFDWFWLNGRLL